MSGKRLPLQAFSKEMLGLLLKMFRAISQRENHPLAKGQVTIPQFLILEALYEAQPRKLREFSQILKVTPSAVTGIIERMEKEQWIHRTADSRDRRVHWMWLTLKGKKLVLSVLRQKEKSIRAMFTELTDQERWVYLRLFRKVVGQK
ncbi:MAG: MarR family transcriptional regulator [Candidatus Omnitrophica bacterium]|nr:MarR family transcriptional regulator [Candidatus Omnitrophota bacterium]